MNGEHNRLEGLLSDPREAPDVEIKCWLDLADGDDKATLAKALLALANHGGGYVIIGLDETSGFAPASGRPDDLKGYSQDNVNGIVHRYAEPPFHCSVQCIQNPISGVTHPIIGVPGSHPFPIRAKRNSPNSQTVQQHAIYIRRPGPQSAPPLTGLEWNELFAKCLSVQRDESLDHIHGLLRQIHNLLPVRPSPGGDQDEMSRLNRWAEDCENIWRDKIAELQSDSPARCPYGFFTFAYHVDGGTPLRSDGALLDVLRDAPRLTGWNTWWAPTRPALAPYIRGGAIECWFGRHTGENRQGYLRDAAYSDFWRVTRGGRAFLLRGYQEDGTHAAQAGIQPGTCLDPTLPIWRSGEGLLHAK
ncbi:MAG: ATP-binding protein, partial [Acidobacteriota bacterium]|nr:ATP-binding protein [Acidobacteriota bacterium]